MLRPLLVCVCLVALSHSAFAGAPAARPGGPRVRAQDPRIAKFLDVGLKRSPTLRALVDRIEASDVIVYVAAKPLMKSYLSGAMTFVASAGGYRYVRASINADQVPDVMIATIAHEFQHVVEVIDEPSVTDEDSLVRLYKRIGISRIERPLIGWETLAAQAMGAQVRKELVSHANAVTEVASGGYSRDL